MDAIEEFAVEASIIKVYSSEVLDYCADECLQIHGGYGFIEEFQPERLLRDSRINRIFEGTNEINRLIVPATILKRAMKGQVPLLAHSQLVRESLAKGKIPERGAGELGEASQVVDFCKWIATYTLAVAAETYHVNIADEQEILGEIADLVSRVYAMDTLVARVRQIDAGNVASNKAVAHDILTAYAPPAYSFCVHTARHVLDGRLRRGVAPRAPRGHRQAPYRLAEQGHRRKAPGCPRGPRGRRLPHPARRLRARGSRPRLAALPRRRRTDVARGGVSSKKTPVDRIAARCEGSPPRPAERLARVPNREKQACVDSVGPAARP